MERFGLAVLAGERLAFDGTPGSAPGDERESLAGEHGEAETFHEAVSTVATQLPVSLGALRRKSEMVAGLQATLSDF